MTMDGRHPRFVHAQAVTYALWLVGQRGRFPQTRAVAGLGDVEQTRGTGHMFWRCL
jgi:hypothetical protein